MSNLIRLLEQKANAEAVIAKFMEPVNEAQSELVAIQTQIDAIILEPVKQSRLASGKDTGTVDVLIDGVMVKHQLTKRIVWHQDKMEGIRALIRSHNDDPDKYMKTKTEYKVDEKAYSQFPPEVKAVFGEAREIKTGAPKVTFDTNWR